MHNLENTHPDYDNNKSRWEFYLRSYLGGNDYFEGAYLTRYVSEDKEEYSRRLDLTPVDNHCKNIVHIYSSFLWRVPPVRVFNSITNDASLSPFLKDSDLDGRSFNAFMRDAQIWSSVYGHVYILIDKPESNAGTRAEELEQDIRPYVSIYTPENVFDWRYTRQPSGRFQLTYLKLRESIDRVDDTTTEIYYKIWTEETIQTWKSTNNQDQMMDEIENPIKRVPAVFLPAARSVIRGIGLSDLSDISYMQKAIYQELSEIEQLIRISNHPTLVKTFQTDASAGAGAIINLPDDMDQGLKPYQMQPSGSNLDAVRNAISDKVNSINRMAHMGAVRGTEVITQSGVAMQTEFQMLNAKLSEKSDLLELAEEQVWDLYCRWQDLTNDVEVFYPDSFDMKDVDKELTFLQQLRATGINSTTLSKEVDKRIADLLLDDDVLAAAHREIDNQTQAIGDFTQQASA